MDYPYMFPEIIGGAALGVFVAIFLIVYLLIIAWGVLAYVLQSVSFQTIAKRRGIKHSWLAWIPVGALWILGSISDQYQYVAKGKVRNRRKVLLGLCIAVLLLLIPYCFVIVCIAAEIPSVSSVAGWTVAFIFCLLAMIAISITLTVFEYIALYDLFVSCDSSQAVLYLLLSIFLPVTLPFFLMSCRKKDLGMPQRKPEPQEVLEAAEDVVSDEDFEEIIQIEETQETLAGDFVEEGLDEAVEES